MRMGVGRDFFRLFLEGLFLFFLRGRRACVRMNRVDAHCIVC
jgi:hypothetical protein